MVTSAHRTSAIGTYRTRVGVDVLAVAEVAASVRRFGDRYLRRVFTDHELACCGEDPARLAARFCAKEAVVKVLEPVSVRHEWRSIEIRRAPHGACQVHLSGLAARLAAAAGIGEVAVSLTHDAGIAAAVVVTSPAGYP